jgi:hypothetical protein
MNRWAVIPSPAVGEPAKKSPIITNIIRVSGGVIVETGFNDKASCLIFSTCEMIVVHPPFWGIIIAKKTRLPAIIIIIWTTETMTDPIKPPVSVYINVTVPKSSKIETIDIGTRGAIVLAKNPVIYAIVIIENKHMVKA